MSLRKTGLTHTPQHPLPANKLCQYTPHGFAPDIRSPCTVPGTAETGSFVRPGVQRAYRAATNRQLSTVKPIRSRGRLYGPAQVHLGELEAERRRGVNVAGNVT